MEQKIGKSGVRSNITLKKKKAGYYFSHRRINYLYLI